MQYSGNQRNKIDTPSVAIKETSPKAVGSIKNPLIKKKLVGKRSAKKLHFPPEVEKMARGLRTRASAKIFSIDSSHVQAAKISESAHEEFEFGEWDQKIKDCKINWTKLI